MTEHELYLGTKAVLDSPKKWTKFEYARDKDGYEVESDDQSAVCFCLVGAINHVAKGKGIDGGYRPTALKNVIVGNGFIYITAFNDADSTTYEDVIRVLDEAIAATEPAQ